MVNETAKEGFRRLAFGGIHDAVRLLFCEDVNPRTLKNMDLFAVSEIRRPKNGGMEIRFSTGSKRCGSSASSRRAGRVHRRCSPPLKAVRRR